MTYTVMTYCMRIGLSNRRWSYRLPCLLRQFCQCIAIPPAFALLVTVFDIFCCMELFCNFVVILFVVHRIFALWWSFACVWYYSDFYVFAWFVCGYQACHVIPVLLQVWFESTCQSYFTIVDCTRTVFCLKSRTLLHGQCAKNKTKKQCLKITSKQYGFKLNCGIFGSFKQ